MATALAVSQVFIWMIIMLINVWLIGEKL